MDVTVVGIGPVYVDRVEYLNEDVLDDFNDSMQDLLSVLNKARANNYAEYSSEAEYQQDYQTVVEAVNKLAKLARDGRVVNVPNGLSYTAYLNGDMVQSLNDVMKSLKFVGISADPTDQNKTPAEQVTAMKSWLQMSGLGVYDIVEEASLLVVNAKSRTDPTIRDRTGALVQIERSPTRTLQSMLELEYIKVGNDIFSNQLIDLENDLSLTKEALNQLQIAHIISNQLTVQGPQGGYPIPLPTTTNPFDFRDQYRAAIEAYTGTAGNPVIIPVANPSPTAAQQLYQVKLELQKISAAMAKAHPSAATEDGSLAQTVQNVISDISAQFSQITYNGNIENLLHTDPAQFEQIFKPAAKAWILDGQDHSVNPQPGQSQPGSIYKTLTTAIKTGENLNDSQRDDVKRYLHIFEEFYKSTAGMLAMLGDIFSKITMGINKS